MRRGHRLWRFALLVTVIGLGAGIAGAQAATVRLPQNARSGTGLDIVVPVSVEPADGVTSMDFVIQYDPAQVQPTGVYRTAFAQSFQLTSDLATPGEVDLSLTGAAPLTGNGEVAWIVFRVVGATGESADLLWVTASLNGGAIPADTIDGRIAIRSATATIFVPDDAQGEPGSQVVIPISTTTIAGGEAFDLDLRFNPNVLAAVSVAKTALTSPLTLVSNISVPGRVVVTLYGTTPINGQGALVNITFNVVGTIGDEAPLDLTRGDINEGGISTLLDDGLFVACDDTDTDGDGVSQCDGDCAPDDGAIYAGAPEVCDGVDNQCPGDPGYGQVDEGVTTRYYRDFDGDGFGDPADFVDACEAPGGYVLDATDCNDGDASVNPLASEICNNVDDDCDGSIDEDVPAPAGIPALSLLETVAGTELDWTLVIDATAYDITSGDVATLAGGAGDFSLATDRCVADDVAGPPVLDALAPLPGSATWYLVRAVNCGGNGSYDSGSAGQEGLRDAEIGASPVACP